MSDQNKYNVTYSNGALKVLDEMKKEYDFQNREDTLNFALLVLKRLRDEGTVSLKKKEE